MAIEIVSFPINRMVIFHSCVNVYQRVQKTIERSTMFNGTCHEVNHHFQ